METDHEVIVIGGGAAGLSAAVALGRSRRSVLVIDAGEPRNAPADGVHNFLSREGTPPGDLLAAGRAEVSHYGGEIRSGRAVSGRAARRRLRGDAGGLQPGHRAPAGGHHRPGRRAARRRGRAPSGGGATSCTAPTATAGRCATSTIAVLGTGPGSVHQALLFSQLTDDLTFVTHGFDPDEDARGMLAAAGVAVVEGPVQAVSVDDDAVTGLRLADGRLVPATAITVATYMRARSEVLTSLGIETVPHPPGWASTSWSTRCGRPRSPGCTPPATWSTSAPR